MERSIYLYIISNKEGLDYVLLNVKKVESYDKHLIAFIDVSGFENELRDRFEYVYNLSNESDENVVKFFIENVLDITFTNKEEMLKLDKPHKKYDKIYFYEDYLKDANIDIKKYQDDIYWENLYYGNSNILKSFCDFERINYIHIEHAAYLDSYAAEYNDNEGLYPAIITTGDYRKDCISKATTKDIIKIGPYIHYASNFYTDEFIIFIKKLFKKTLLVFPTHSISTKSMSYQVEDFIQYIKKIAKENNFNTILICMYFCDINQGRELQYIDNNFNIVSCGTGNAFTFMNKLKTLMNLSDYTLSNGIGSYIGYSIYLNKPFHLYKQHLEFKDLGINKNNILEAVLLDNENTDQMYRLFSTYCKEITVEQYECCNKYWGFNYIKDKEEMKFILVFYNEVYQICIDKITLGMPLNKINEIYKGAIDKKLIDINNKFKSLILESR